ncbi:MAG: hypothetical protein WCR66_13860 [Bacteroidota bacterium]
MAVATGTALAAAAVASAAANAYGSSNASDAAENAANIQAQYGQNAINEQRRQFDINQKNQEPFLKTGQAANTQLNYGLGLGGADQTSGQMGASGSLLKPFTMADYQQDPGYQFRLSEGQKALDRASAAGGKYFSGGAIKGLTDYNQNSASNEYQNAYNRYNTNQTNTYNRLAGVSGAGQTAANNLGTTGQENTNQISAGLTGIGNAQAAGQVGSANAWSTGLSNIGNNALFASSMYGMKGWGGNS